MIKKIAAAIALFVVLVLGYAATRPGSFRVERSVTIQAPPKRVYPLVSDIRAQNSWSPWDKKDPALKRSYSGAKTGVGSVYEWDGNKEVGQGRLEITQAVAPSMVVMSLDFVRPMAGHSVAAFALEPKEGGTEVTWSISGPMPFASKLISVFCDMDKMIGKDFEAGLADLKALAEKKR
jgi:uncharacterized protein YndB with AHSA1/START domain